MSDPSAFSFSNLHFGANFRFASQLSAVITAADNSAPAFIATGTWASVPRLA
jgi:hypothetical protein